MHKCLQAIAFNAYGLLLFGGPIKVDTHGNGLLIDDWQRLRGWARIGVLVSRLRALLDDTLRKRIDQPSACSGEDKVIGIVRRLVQFNGQDQ
jgi:ATP-dependent RNA helicase DHX57